MPRTHPWRAVVLALVCASCASVRLPSALLGAPPADATPGLTVPYVAQSELLCGGAAIAMMERFWGRRGVFAEQFTHLVRRDEGGIRTTDLARAVQERGWTSHAGTADAELVRQSLADSAPVIALIEVAPRRYHFVVLLAWTDSVVTYHDPAIAPSMRLSTSRFLAKWNGAARWALFARPSARSAVIAARSPAPQDSIAPDSLPCRPWLDRAADAATANRLADADDLLTSATASCPDERLVLRERAGVRFRQGRHAEAAALAEDYTAAAPADSLGWQLLASSRYLLGDATGALRAWNAVGRPIVDHVRIEGTRRIRFRALTDDMHLQARDLLTSNRFLLARRRLADVPALEQVRMDYRAVTGGVVEVQASVNEHPLVDPLAELLVAGGLRAAVRREVFLTLGTPFGLGESVTAHWRWREADPRLVVHVDLPVSGALPGVLSVERGWETWRYTASVTEARRTASAISLAGWMRPDLEQRVGARHERWSGEGEYVALSAGTAVHEADDRISLLAEAEHAIPLGSALAYDRLSGRATWRLPADRWANTWSVRLGADWVSQDTPRGLWPLVGGGLTLGIPLRAHPWILEDRLPAARIGRAVAHGGVAADRALVTLGRLSLGGGLFLDGAHVASALDRTTPARWYLDGGAGVRVGITGVPWASVRLDLARGLAADRRWGVSAALAERPFPRLGRLR